jgi:hypothetical protein
MRDALPRYTARGEIITVEEVKERSAKSHRHYFAVINEAWQNLPEDLADEFPNAEALRKRALIKNGLCHADGNCSAPTTPRRGKAVAAFTAADPYCFLRDIRQGRQDMARGNRSR